MKKILFSLSLMIGFTVAANAQASATSTPGNVPTKPKTAVEISKANGTATTPTDTTKTATVNTEKKCAKKSCCKKEEASTAKAESCAHDKSKGGACCKDKKVEATKKD